MAEVEQFYGTGRRKSSSARVFLKPGKGDIKVNKRSLEEYFGTETSRIIVRRPLSITNAPDFDIYVTVRGGGMSGQADAICLGISRALLQYNEDYRQPLREAGLLTRDARIKERKKVGLHGARKRPQYSKR